MRRARERQAGDHETVERPPARVLVAEDDQDIRDFIAAGLRRDGHVVLEANDGAELIHSVVSAGGAPVPDVIVADVRMPGVSGLEALSYLRLANCPVRIVFVSAHFDAETRAEAERLGADGLLRKPFDIYELRELVWKISTTPMGPLS